MLARLFGALVRAVLVMLLVAAPSMIVPGMAPDTAEVVALLALFAATLTFVEYFAACPCIIEFRDAPPFNRVRFASLLLMVVLLSVACKGATEPTTLTQFVAILGAKVGSAFDFAYSPVRFVTLMLPVDSVEQIAKSQAAAGIAFIVALVTLATFVLLMRAVRWPTNDGAFNVWINLPTFDPTTGGDVVRRLRRDARLNIALGFLLPFLMPVAVHAAGLAFHPLSMESDQTLIWTMAGWAFLPVSLFMRGIAMGRVATMISDKRRHAAETEGARLRPA